MSRLDTINAEISKVRSAVEALENNARSEGRDLDDHEQGEVETLLARADVKIAERDKEVARLASDQKAAEVLSRFSTPKIAAPETMTAGEFLVSALKAQAGVISQDEHLSRTAVVRAQMATTDNAGIVPAPIIGQVLSMYDAERPVWNSFTSRDMPNEGKTFTRPEITQHVLTGDQASEFATVSSQKMTITGNTVTKFTEAGYLDLSQQDIDWTSPNALQLVVEDFAKVFSRRLETRATAYLATLASASVAWTTTNVGTIVTSVTNGVQAVYDTSDNYADTLWLSLDEALYLAGTTTADYNKTAMQMVKEGLSAAGLNINVVVGPRLSANTRILGVSGLVESYLQEKGLVQIAQPDVLGQRLAYHGYGALFGKAAGFVSLI